MSDPLDLDSEIKSLEAFLDSESSGIDVALEKLEGFIDPNSLRRRASLLIKSERAGEAADLLKDFKLNKEFIEVYILAKILSGDDNGAIDLVKRSHFLKDDTGTLEKRAILSLGQSALHRHENKTGEFRSHLAVEPADRDLFFRIIEFTSSFVDASIKDASKRSALDLELINLHCAISGYVGLGDKVNREMETLVALKGPVSPQVAFLASCGRLAAPTGLESVLLDANNESPIAKRAVALIRANRDSDIEWAFSYLQTHIKETDDCNQITFYFSALVDITMQGPGVLRKSLLRMADEILDLNNLTHQGLLAKVLILNEMPEKAVKIFELEGADKNPIILEAKARYYEVNGEQERALFAHRDSSFITLSEIQLIEVVNLAYQLGSIDIAIEAAQKINNYYPWAKNVKRNLASLYLTARKLDLAIEVLEEIVEHNNLDSVSREDLARSYMWRGELENSEKHLRYLFNEDETSISSLILFAHVLRALNKVNEAFRVLHERRDNFWSNQEYLFAYLSTAYAAGNEEQAHEALVELEKLRTQGVIEKNRLQKASVEDIVALGNQHKEQEEKISKYIIKGKMPWSFASELMNRPLVWDWSVRTQKISWLTEDEKTRSAIGIYSSNHIGVDYSEDPEGFVKKISTTKIGGGVCLDPTAIVALYKLNILETLDQMFDEIIVPDDILLNIVHESENLLPAQRTNEDGLKQIRSMVDHKEIEIVDYELTTHIDEYSDKENVKSLIDLVNSMRKSGQLTSEDESKIEKVALNQKPSGDDDDILPKARISISLNSIMTLYQIGLLGVSANAVRLCLVNTDYETVVNNLVTYDEKLKAYKALHESVLILRGLKNIKFLSAPILADGVTFDNSVAFSALRIALARNIPLLADDRTLQATAINNKRTTNDAAYGTDLYLEKLYKTNKISLDNYAECYMRLISWRYRFLVIPREIIQHQFERYKGAMPGAGIEIVAKYMHDSLMDPGLFSGPEPAKIPVSAAMRLCMIWTKEVSEFLGCVVLDPDIPAEKAIELGKWVGNYMLPAVPATLLGRSESMLGEYIPRAAITYTLLATAGGDDYKKIAEVLQNLAQQINISKREYNQIVAEVCESAVGIK